MKLTSSKNALPNSKEISSTKQIIAATTQKQEMSKSSKIPEQEEGVVDAGVSSLPCGPK